MLEKLTNNKKGFDITDFKKNLLNEHLIVI